MAAEGVGQKERIHSLCVGPSSGTLRILFLQQPKDCHKIQYYHDWATFPHRVKGTKDLSPRQTIFVGVVLPWE